MARKQTRRTVSLSDAAMTALRVQAQAEGKTQTALVEELVRARCGLPPSSQSMPLEVAQLAVARRAETVAHKCGNDDELCAAEAARERAEAAIAAARARAEATRVSRAEIDALAFARRHAVLQPAIQQSAAIDAEAHRRRQLHAEAHPCRKSCGDDSWHGVGDCNPSTSHRRKREASP